MKKKILIQVVAIGSTIASVMPFAALSSCATTPSVTTYNVTLNNAKGITINKTKAEINKDFVCNFRIPENIKSWSINKITINDQTLAKDTDWKLEDKKLTINASQIKNNITINYSYIL